ncbi:MAG TPA: M56 family metallopeptidase, partial [Thermoanaerobaculia bacterium]|nr:M56 family metallopeptidase [Thermoanaerobaculia bacterium]
GVAGILLWLAAGQLAVWRLARKATPLHDPLIDEARAHMGVTRKVRVVSSNQIGAPFTSGWLRPIILLPAEATAWPVERRRAALLHELAHVARNDAPVHLLAGLACALYWMHPAVWLALRRLRREGEQATDDRVIARGMIAPEYAAQLVDVASAARTRRIAGLAGVAMACPSHLETRLRALLDESRIRGVVSRRIAVIAALSVALILVPLAGARPTPLTLDRTVEAQPGGTLVLDLETGADLKITGDDSRRVELHAKLGGRDAVHTVVDMQAVDSEVLVTSKFNQRSGTQSSSHDFTLRVPRQFNVRLKSAGGDLTMSDVEGRFEGSTGGGEIDLTRVRGTARLSTGGGDVLVTNSQLDGKITTGGGTVRFEGVSGGLRGSSGSGPVVDSSDSDEVTVNPIEHDRKPARIRTSSGGVIEITKAGGQVELDDAPHGAIVHSGGGRIVIGRAGGDVEASTGGGMIRVGPVAGSVRAGTGAGMVVIEIEDAGGRTQNVAAKTGHGPIEITLPANYSGRFEIETAYTESHEPVSIRSDWELEYEPVTGLDGHEGTPRRYVRATGRAGSGDGLVRVRAVNGDVRIRRN